jgi:hypothetical protein
MRRRQWTVQRTVRAENNGQHRWDRAYQQLLAWTNPERDHENRPTPLPSLAQEENYENRDVCPSVYPAPGTDTDQ